LLVSREWWKNVIPLCNYFEELSDKLGAKPFITLDKWQKEIGFKEIIFGQLCDQEK